MNEHPAASPVQWLDLRQAADRLGVHFTTLRRWADAELIPSMRTPGGRRRFRSDEVNAFLEARHHGGPPVTDTAVAHPQGVPPVTLAAHPGGTRLIAVAPDHEAVTRESWYDRLDPAQRNSMRRGGHALLAVLMQYASRTNGGEAFLREGERFAAQYGEQCWAGGLSLVETVRAALTARRAIKDAVYGAGNLAGSADDETQRLYDRVTTFLDSMLLTTVEAYERAGRHEPPQIRMAE